MNRPGEGARASTLRPRITAMVDRPRRLLHFGNKAGGRTYAKDKGRWWAFGKVGPIYLIGIRILLCPQRLYFCWLVGSLLLGLFFCIEPAMAAQPTGGEIVMAPSGEPSVNQAPPSEEQSVNQAPPSEEQSVNQAPPSEEQSVNQTPPEFHPVQLELAQRAQSQHEIQQEIMKLYRNYILSSSPWMKFNTEYLNGPDITNVARLIMGECDLESVSTGELDLFLQDIRANPKQLDSFFKELWGKGRRG